LTRLGYSFAFTAFAVVRIRLAFALEFHTLELEPLNAGEP
jgi:hypothetical protein